LELDEPDDDEEDLSEEPLDEDDFDWLALDWDWLEPDCDLLLWFELFELDFDSLLDESLWSPCGVVALVGVDPPLCCGVLPPEL